MSAIAKYAKAWSLTLAPILLFTGFEIAALPQFVRAAQSTGKAPLAIVGIVVALVIMVFSAVMEYYFAADYWAERSFR